jgi:hypothetical protein
VFADDVVFVEFAVDILISLNGCSLDGQKNGKFVAEC